MSGDQLDLDAVEARWGDQWHMAPNDVRALVAEVRRLRALVVVDDDSHPAFQPPSDSAGYYVESP